MTDPGTTVQATHNPAIGLKLGESRFKGLTSSLVARESLRSLWPDILQIAIQNANGRDELVNSFINLFTPHNGLLHQLFQPIQPGTVILQLAALQNLGTQQELNITLQLLDLLLHDVDTICAIVWHALDVYFTVLLTTMPA
jgi:hypothetical protein